MRGAGFQADDKSAEQTVDLQGILTYPAGPNAG